MSCESWVERLLNCQFPLLKDELALDEAQEILCSHRPNKLYKYRQADIYGFSIIEKGELWLARADTVNDEYDCFYAYDAEKILDSHEEKFRRMYPDVSDEEIRQRRQFTRGKIEHDLNELREYFRKSFALCSLSEQVDIPKMWQEYSGNHSGFCIEFNLQNVQPELWKMLLPIFYTDEKVDISEFIVGTYKKYETINASFMRRAALTKSLKWKYEQEWRMIYLSEPNKQGVPLRGIPISCVYLGYEASQDTSDHVESICRRKNIPLKKIQIM